MRGEVTALLLLYFADYSHLNKKQRSNWITSGLNICSQTEHASFQNWRVASSTSVHKKCLLFNPGKRTCRRPVVTGYQMRDSVLNHQSLSGETHVGTNKEAASQWVEISKELGKDGMVEKGKGEPGYPAVSCSLSCLGINKVVGIFSLPPYPTPRPQLPNLIYISVWCIRIQRHAEWSNWQARYHQRHRRSIQQKHIFFFKLSECAAGLSSLSAFLPFPLHFVFSINTECARNSF